MQIDQYTAIVFLSVMTSAVLMVLIINNVRLEKEKKNLFLISTFLILISSIVEYLGVYLNGTPEKYRMLHVFLKVFELSVSPFIVILLISVFNGSKRAEKLFPIAGGNLILQVVTGFTGFLYYVDESNIYHHNTYYWIYTVVYIVCGIFFFVECTRFSYHYQNRSSASLLAILVFLTAGLSIHPLQNDIRVDWLTLSAANAFFYIYYNNLVEQMDSLTQLLDRKSYDIRIKSLNHNLFFAVFDIDFFKKVNDTWRHEAGDECLRIVSAQIKNDYGRYGLCYRTGGDEFCVIMNKKPANLSGLESAFCADLDKVRHNSPDAHISTVSVGYAPCDPASGNSIADALHEADEMMYQYKRKRRTSVSSAAQL